MIQSSTGTHDAGFNSTFFLSICLSLILLVIKIYNLVPPLTTNLRMLSFYVNRSYFRLCFDFLIVFNIAIK